MKSLDEFFVEILDDPMLGRLRWLTVTRRGGTTPEAPDDGPVIYGIRSAEDIVSGTGRAEKGTAR